MVRSRAGWSLSTWMVVCGVIGTGALALAQPGPAAAPGPGPVPAPPSGAASPLAPSATSGGAPMGGTTAAAPGGARVADTLEARLAPAVAGGLTAEDVAGRAAATSYDVKARQEAIHAAEARVQQAEVGYYPRLTLTASYTRLSPITPPVFNLGGAGGATGGMGTGGMTGATGGGGPEVSFPVFLDNYLGQANLTVPISDYVLRLSQNYAAATGSLRAAEMDERAAKLVAAANGRIAYYDWLRAQAQVVIAERTIEQGRAHVADAQHRFDAGTASRADVLQAQSQLASAELTLEQARNAAAYAEEQLRVIMHDDPGRRYAIGEDLRADLPPLPDVSDLRTLVVEALDHRLEVRALDDTVYSLREQAKVARATGYPRLDAFGDAIYANPNQRIFPPRSQFDATWDVGVRLTWSPNDTFSSKGAGDQLSAQAAQTEAQRSALLDSIRLEVTQSYQALNEAMVAVRTGSEALASAEEAYRVRNELFRNGRATSTELTDSEVLLFQASLNLVNARANLRVARARLLHAVGRDIPPAARPAAAR